MFVRYLGGGIGHLEQFPSAENNDEDSAVNDNGDMEIEAEDFIIEASNDNNNEGGGDKGVGEDGDEEEDTEEVEEIEDGEEDDDAGESSDEETGNVY